MTEGAFYGQDNFMFTFPTTLALNDLLAEFLQLLVDSSCHFV
jgi:hypothetical protein